MSMPETPALIDDQPAPDAALSVPEAAPEATPEVTPETAPDTAPEPTAETAPTAAVLPAVAELSPAACSARLAELFPAVFAPGAAKPLKLRIQADVQQRAPGIFTKKSLSIFLHRHTTSTAYLKALVNAKERFDLDGQPAGEVADEHRLAATTELDRRRAMHDERRAAEREAQRVAQRDAHRQAQESARREQEAARREQEANEEPRRERAALLRAFEATTLTRANFCALKGLVEADLEAQLVQARQERELRALAPRPEHPNPADRSGRADPRPNPRPNQRPDARGPRPPRQQPPRR